MYEDTYNHISTIKRTQAHTIAVTYIVTQASMYTNTRSLHTHTESYLEPTLEHYGIFVIQDPPDFKNKY